MASSSQQPSSPKPSTSKRPLDDNEVPEPKKVKKDLTWTDAYRLTLSTDEDGSEVKVMVRVGRNEEGEIKGVVTCLRRSFPNEGITLKLEDLKTIEEKNYDHHSLVDWGIYLPSHTLTCQQINMDVLFEVTSKGETKKIQLDYSVFRKFVLAIPALRYIVSGLGRRFKKTITQDSLFTLVCDQIVELHKSNKFEGSLEKDILKSRDVVLEKMAVVERALEIPRNLTLSILNDPVFPSLVSKYQSYHHSEKREMHDQKIRLIVKNEV